MYGGVHWTSQVIQGTRTTRPCLTGHPYITLRQTGTAEGRVPHDHRLLIEPQPCPRSQVQGGNQTDEINLKDFIFSKYICKMYILVDMS